MTLKPPPFSDPLVQYLVYDYFFEKGSPPRRLEPAVDGTLTVDTSRLADEIEELVSYAVHAWDMVSALKFEFIDGPADITFFPKASGNNYAWSNGEYAQIYLNQDMLKRDGLTINSDSMTTILHEIGHALGLGHPGPYGDPAAANAPSFSDDAIFWNDNQNQTVMSYFSVFDNPTFSPAGPVLYPYYTSSGGDQVTPMIKDVMAIQYLYGMPQDHRLGDDTYGGTSMSSAIVDLFAGHAPKQEVDKHVAGGFWNIVINDNGGVDTIDFSWVFADQQISLIEGEASSVAGGQRNLYIAPGTVIENAVTGFGDDIIYGNSADNTLNGGGGDDQLIAGPGGKDRLFGGDGNDFLQTSLAGEYYGDGDDDFIRLRSQDNMISIVDGGSGEDTIDLSAFVERKVFLMQTDSTFKNFENAIMGAGDDFVQGTGGDNSIRGGAGNDVLVGGAGSDVLQGDAGKDVLNGGSGADTFVFDLYDAGDIYDQQEDNIVHLETIDRIEVRANGYTFFGETSAPQVNGWSIWQNVEGNDVLTFRTPDLEYHDIEVLNGRLDTENVSITPLVYDLE